MGEEVGMVDCEGESLRMVFLLRRRQLMFSKR